LETLGFLRLPDLDGVLETDDSLWFIESLYGVELVDSGLGGWLDVLPFGGWGKAPMLTVLRNPLPAGRGPAGKSSVRSVGRVDECAWFFGEGRWGRAEEDTARVAIAEPGSSDAREEGVTLEARDFATGSEGSGPVGGAIEGREGRGSEWLVMVVVSRRERAGVDDVAGCPLRHAVYVKALCLVPSAAAFVNVGFSRRARRPE
jgi:hypothetical protein